MWTIDYDLIVNWLDTLDNKTIARIFDALFLLEEHGPNLGRPLVDTLEGSRIKNLKELRPASSGRSEVRILFAFDPNRKAIMLLGGDKAKGPSRKLKWAGWYKHAIPEAERLFEQHLKEIGTANDRSKPHEPCA